MVNYSLDDDSDEELGAYIYRTSHTAKLFREEVSRDNDNETSTNNNYKSNSISTRKSKRKNPPEGDVSTVLSNEKVARKRKGDACIRHGAKKIQCMQT